MQISKTLLTCGAAALCLVAISSRAADSETDQKLRDALHQKMAELGPETPEPAKPAKVKAPKPSKAPKAQAPAAPVKPAPVAPAPAAASKPVAPAPVVVQPAPAPAKPAATAEEEHLRDAVRARLAAPQQTQATTAPTTSAPAKPAPSASPAPAAPSPVTPPPSPISGSKEQRLSALLQQYKADQITPQQYHEQRAKILAE